MFVLFALWCTLAHFGALWVTLGDCECELLWRTLVYFQTAVNVVGVIEQCCFNSYLDPFNVQTANSILKQLKVIESKLMLKKTNLECY